MAHPRDAAATKARLLDAAFDEFAAHGPAGARVDRIAEAAGTSKRMIYVYFGSKDELFAAAIDKALDHILTTTPYTADDLPGYAGRYFDMFVESPQVLRLYTWWQLAEAEPTPALAAVTEQIRHDIAAAQLAGLVSDLLSPGDIHAFVQAVAVAWASGAPGVLRQPGEDLAAQRAAVVTAVEALTRPAAG